MPIYEYGCKRCGTFEVVQRPSERPLKRCPTCGTKVNKLISLSAFHLKGSGWYASDYGSNASKTKGNGEAQKGEAQKKDGGEAKKDDAKPKAGTEETKRPAKEASGTETQAD